LNDTRKTRQLQDEEKQSDAKECIPGCVIERHGEEEKSVSEVIITKSDESLTIEPDILQVDQFTPFFLDFFIDILS